MPEDEGPYSKTMRALGYCPTCGKPLTADGACSEPEFCGICTECGQPDDECTCDPHAMLR